MNARTRRVSVRALPAWYAILAALGVLLLVACGGEERAPEPSLTIVPTATLTPAHQALGMKGTVTSVAMLSDGLPAVQGASKALTATGENLMADALPGDSMVRVTNVSRFLPAMLVGIGQGETFEIKRIKGTAGDLLVFGEPLEHPHDVGESVEIIG